MAKKPSRIERASSGLVLAKGWKVATSPLDHVIPVVKENAPPSKVWELLRKKPHGEGEEAPERQARLQYPGVRPILVLLTAVPRQSEPLDVLYHMYPGRAPSTLYQYEVSAGVPF